jgi:hypothetical protein
MMTTPHPNALRASLSLVALTIRRICTPVARIVSRLVEEVVRLATVSDLVLLNLLHAFVFVSSIHHIGRLPEPYRSLSSM